jgi:hypothetical protein
MPEDRASPLIPEELRRRQLAALTAWVMAGARIQPVVLALEDMHWADPTALDCVELPSAVRLRSYLFLSPRDPSFVRPGVLTRITPQFRSRRWISIRSVIWSASWQPVTRCPRR